MTGKERVIEEIKEEEGGRGFDLRRGPLLRVKLIEVGEREHIGIIVMHHIVSDGWSMGILIKEMNELYGWYSGGREVGLKELKVQYRDYAYWQSEWMRGGEYDEEVRYWERELGGEERETELPTDYMRPAVQRYEGEVESVRIGRGESEKLRKVSEKGRCSREYKL